MSRGTEHMHLPNRVASLEKRQVSLEQRQALSEASNAQILSELVKVNAAFKENNAEIVDIKIAVERIATSGRVVWVAASILVPSVLAVIGAVVWAFETFQRVPHQ